MMRGNTAKGHEDTGLWGVEQAKEVKSKFTQLRLSLDKNKSPTQWVPVSKEVVVRLENGLKKLFVMERVAGTFTEGMIMG